MSPRPKFALHLTQHDLDLLRESHSILVARGQYDDEPKRNAHALELMERLEQVPCRGPYALIVLSQHADVDSE